MRVETVKKRHTTSRNVTLFYQHCALKQGILKVFISVNKDDNQKMAVVS